jgi:hypothetical protein
MLKNKESYLKTLDSNVKEILDCYIYVISEYYVIINSNLKINNSIKKKFIIRRGLDTLTHIFNYILYYTKNIKLTMEYLEKSIYLYIEFIEQINQTENSFLEFNSRDATQYIYKKTIYELKKKYKTDENYFELNMIDKFICLFKMKLYEIINNETLNKKEIISELEKIMIVNN